MAHHTLKSWPEQFKELMEGRNYDLRKNDRKYKVGDTVTFQEYDDRAGKKTLAELRRRICWMTEDVGPGAITPLKGLSTGYCILGLGAP